MFYCTCRYHTCKKSYKTKLARTQHIAGVKSARKKETHHKLTNDRNSKNILLQPKDCLKVCHLLSNVFKYIKNLKNKHESAKVIPNPRIPNTLSDVLYMSKNPFCIALNLFLGLSSDNI